MTYPNMSRSASPTVYHSESAAKLEGKSFTNPFSFRPVPSPADPNGVFTRKSKSHARKQDPGHVPRPRNAFILFRCDFVDQWTVPDNAVSDHRDLSRIAGRVWREMSEEEKRPWFTKAEEEKRQHTLAFPSYRYTPGPLNRPKRVYRRRPKPLLSTGSCDFVDPLDMLRRASSCPVRSGHASPSSLDSIHVSDSPTISDDFVQDTRPKRATPYQSCDYIDDENNVVGLWDSGTARSPTSLNAGFVQISLSETVLNWDYTHPGSYSYGQSTLWPGDVAQNSSPSMSLSDPSYSPQECSVQAASSSVDELYSAWKGLEGYHQQYVYHHHAEYSAPEIQTYKTCDVRDQRYTSNQCPLSYNILVEPSWRRETCTVVKSQDVISYVDNGKMWTV